MERKQEKTSISVADQALCEQIDLVISGVLGALVWVEMNDPEDLKTIVKFNVVYDLLDTCVKKLKGEIK